MKKMLNTLLNLGIDENLLFSDVKHVKLLNALTIFSFFLIIAFIPIEVFYYPQTKWILLFNCLMPLAYTSALLFNLTRHYTLARFTFNLPALFFICFTSYQIGPEANGHSNIILVIVTAFFIYPKHERVYQYLVISIALSAFILIEILFYFKVSPVYVPQVAIPIFSVLLNLALILFLIGFAYYISENYKLAEENLEIEKQKVEKAYSLLSKYVAPQLADTISDGKIDQIWKHNRKKLTLFFSDIKDFTTITDSMEPEDMANVLNEYLTEMNTIINKYKGTLAQVIGDGLYVFFGAPESSSDKDHALRCVKMAVEMQQKMIELNKKWFKKGIDEVLQIRCGINTGMSTVGGYGSSERKEYTAMGMQTNIAARLEQTCEPGGILISHTTWALVNDEISCSEQGQINVKGLNRSIRAYRINALANETNI
jgi:class 3 adenylate cyclase